MLVLWEPCRWQVCLGHGEAADTAPEIKRAEGKRLSHAERAVAERSREKPSPVHQSHQDG